MKWPASGRTRDITPAVRGKTNSLERGTKSKVAHKWADWLHGPYHPAAPRASEQETKSKCACTWADSIYPPRRICVPNDSKRVTKSQVPCKWTNWLHNPHVLRGFDASEYGTKSKGVEEGPRTADWLHNIRPFGITVACGRGTKSQLAHKWADWLITLCQPRGLERFRSWDKMRSGPQVGGLAT